MSLHSFFSDGYVEARDRFRVAATEAGARFSTFPIAAEEDLTIDVCEFGERSADNTLVVSSGVHGVEGPVGSAVQTAWLETLSSGCEDNRVRMVLVHSINPYGFHHHRRWNEDNVDLNRNFVSESDRPVCAPETYRRLSGLLNPTTPPNRWEPFQLKALASIARHGLPAIKQAVAGGQYEYPKGLFYGGGELSCSARVLDQHYVDWVGSSRHVVHIDLHTGLGRFGDYVLLLDGSASGDTTTWFAEVAGPKRVESGEQPDTAYQSTGSLGEWLAQKLGQREFRFATAEWGTYGPVRVLGALRAENRAFHHGDRLGRDAWTVRELRECFCPQSQDWRHQVASAGLNLIETCRRQLTSK